MMRLPISACLIFSAALLCGCGGSSSPSSVSQTDETSPGVIRAAVQLNWYPEAEHGGIYQAAADQTYAEAGLEVDIRPGGRATTVGPELEMGRSQFAIANADDVVLYRAQGMDVVAVMAVMQNHPRCILVREDSGVTDFEGLAGKKLARQAGRPFLEFMRSKQLLDQLTEVPYDGSVTALIASSDTVIQAYSYTEPILAEQQGVKVRKLMLSDLGWNPYSSVLITSGKLIREEPKMIRSFVQATRRGWQNYLTDPSLGNEAILKANKHTVTAEVLEAGGPDVKSLAMPEGTELSGVGMMTRDRWDTLVQQMAALKLLDSTTVKADECFTTEFLE